MEFLLWLHLDPCGPHDRHASSAPDITGPRSKLHAWPVMGLPGADRGRGLHSSAPSGPGKIRVRADPAGPAPTMNRHDRRGGDDVPVTTTPMSLWHFAGRRGEAKGTLAPQFRYNGLATQHRCSDRGESKKVIRQTNRLSAGNAMVILSIRPNRNLRKF